MIIRNIEKHTIEVPYEGTTYIFPEGQIVDVNDGVGQFTIEKFPLSFSSGMQLKAKEAKPVETYKTKVYVAQKHLNQEEPVSQTPKVEEIDNNTEEWYGSGIQSDTLN